MAKEYVKQAVSSDGTRTISAQRGFSWQRFLFQWEWMLVLMLILVNIFNISIFPQPHEKHQLLDYTMPQSRCQLHSKINNSHCKRFDCLFVRINICRIVGRIGYISGLGSRRLFYVLYSCIVNGDLLSLSRL